MGDRHLPASQGSTPCHPPQLQGAWPLGQLVAQWWAFHHSQATRLLSGAEMGNEQLLGQSRGGNWGLYFLHGARKEVTVLQEQRPMTHKGAERRGREDSAGPTGSDFGAAVTPLVPGREMARLLEVRVP